MKDVVVDEVKEKILNESEMKRIFKRICNYFNEDEALIKEFKQNEKS